MNILSSKPELPDAEEFNTLETNLNAGSADFAEMRYVHDAPCYQAVKGTVILFPISTDWYCIHLFYPHRSVINGHLAIKK